MENILAMFVGTLSCCLEPGSLFCSTHIKLSRYCFFLFFFKEKLSRYVHITNTCVLNLKPLPFFSPTEVSPLDRRVEHYRQLQLQAMGGSHSFDQSLPATPTPPTPSTLAPSVCKTTILFLVLHGGRCQNVFFHIFRVLTKVLKCLKSIFPFLRP